MPVKPRSKPATGSDGSPAASDSLTSVRLSSRDEMFRMRWTEEEKASTKRMAAIHGLTLTDFVRSRLGLSARYRKPPGTVIRVPKAPKPAPPSDAPTVETELKRHATEILGEPAPTTLEIHPQPAPDPEPVLSLAALMRR